MLTSDVLADADADADVQHGMLPFVKKFEPSIPIV
jgi:hypothetical protein